MTDGDVGARLSLGSGGDANAVGRIAANREWCKQAAQRQTCDEKWRQGKNHPHGALQPADGASGAARHRERRASAWASTEATPRWPPRQWNDGFVSLPCN